MARSPLSRLVEPAPPAGAVETGATPARRRVATLDPRLVWLHEGRGFTLVRLATELAGAR